jgi:hypothetical protein
MEAVKAMRAVEAVGTMGGRASRVDIAGDGIGRVERAVGNRRA